MYWTFLSEHLAKLAGNPRMAMIYRTLDRMPTEHVAAMKSQAERFLDRVC
jgi:deoxyribodipyrimidine photolyase-related protein